MIPGIPTWWSRWGVQRLNYKFLNRPPDTTNPKVSDKIQGAQKLSQEFLNQPLDPANSSDQNNTKSTTAHDVSTTHNKDPKTVRKRNTKPIRPLFTHKRTTTMIDRDTHTAARGLDSKTIARSSCQEPQKGWWRQMIMTIMMTMKTMTNKNHSRRRRW